MTANDMDASVRRAVTAVPRRVLAGLAALVIGVATLLLVLRPLSLDFPATGLDDSWIAVLGRAAALPARWGVDVVFTYGPAADLITRFYTDTYLVVALPILCAVALVQGAAMALLIDHAVAGRRFALATTVAATAAEVLGLATELTRDQDGFFFTLVLTLFLLDLVRRPGSRLSRVVLVAGAGVMGVMAVSKTSFAVLALLVFAISDGRAALTGRRVPSMSLVFLGAASLAYVLHGQRLSDLPAYVDLQGQVAAGYGEAMYLAPSRVEIASFMVGVVALIAATVLLVPTRAGLVGRGSAALATGAVLAIGLKAGFVRADSHPQIAWSTLGLSGLAVSAALALRRSRLGATVLGVASLAALWLLAPFFITINPNEIAAKEAPADYRDMISALDVELGAWGRFLRSPSAFADRARADKASAWAALRNAHPLPNLVGSVDMVPSEQSAVLANGLDYRPRPSFQEYSTYTKGLIAANRAFFAGRDAPDWLIFGSGALDDRYPTSIEGASWPEWLNRYEPQRRIGDWVALRRRTTPLGDVLGSPVDRKAELGEPVAVPIKGPTFARVVVRKTLLGRLAAAVFRPPALSMHVTLAGGEVQVYRFIPALAEEGFLLSPMIEGADGFADLAFGRGGDIGAPVVTAFTVGGSRWAGLFYDPMLSVEFRPVTVPAIVPSPDARGLADDLAHDLAWRRLASEIGRGGQLDGDRLSAPAPTALSIPVAGARRLRLGFGLSDGAWTEGATRGVCFSVAAAGDAGAPLWRRCLDPKEVPADRGPQSAEVDLPEGLAAVSVATACPKSCDWGWSYWSDITPSGAGPKPRP